MAGRLCTWPLVEAMKAGAPVPATGRPTGRARCAERTRREPLARGILLQAKGSRSTLAEAHPDQLGVRTKDGGWTALHMSASLGYSEIVEELLDHGADVEARTRNNDSTPLYVAAREGHVNVL